ncbi:MAG: MFS transporter [Pseudomonadota bacterium]
MSAADNQVSQEAQQTTASGSSQFALLGQRRFAGLFYTQFLGAFNDNIFKAALSLIFVFHGVVATESVDLFVNLAAALFILPYFLLSATAGQIADKYEKSMLVRRIKLAEIVIAVMGGIAVYLQNVYAMLFVLFLLGVQSTFFGPLKFSILPQQLQPQELVGGNAQIEMGTFVAILLGTLLGGIIGNMQGVTLWLTVMVGAVALVGYFSSRFIPECPPTDPGLKVGMNPWKDTWEMIRVARQDRSVYLSVLGISWFWLIGSLALTQIPNLAKVHLSSGTTVVTLILSIFTLAVALGSLICEKASGHRVEIGIVPVGAIGLSLAGVDLYFAIQAFQPVAVLQWLDFLTHDGAIRLMLDFGLVGFFGGMFIVPLYALIQIRTPEQRRARIIAVNNVINAVFMVAGSIFSIVFLGLLGIGIPELLLTAFVMNIAVSAFIFAQVPEFSMRFLIWMLSHSMYRVTHAQLERIPEHGGAMLVCNHVTYVDALILAGAVRRPIRFVMFKPIFDIPVLNFVFRTGGAIPIQSEKEDPAAFAEAMDNIAAGLEAGDLLCIFPEGALTRDGEIDTFRRGIERIVERTPVPVVPLALQGLWGSYFSHDGGVFRNPSRLWSRVCVRAGEPVPPQAVNADDLRQRVLELRADQP